MNKQQGLLSPVQWWEKKRLIYNLVLVLSSIIGFFLRSPLESHSYFNLSNSALIIQIAIIIIGANIFYCMGMATEYLLGHYVKMPYFSNSTRIALFLIGVGFSFFWGVFLIMTI